MVSVASSCLRSVRTAQAHGCVNCSLAVFAHARKGRTHQNCVSILLSYTPMHALKPAFRKSISVVVPVQVQFRLGQITRKHMRRQREKQTHCTIHLCTSPGFGCSCVHSVLVAAS
eukprot:3317253-Amphidinium_carterae.1